jgi:hypothetical protein
MRTYFLSLYACCILLSSLVKNKNAMLHVNPLYFCPIKSPHFLWGLYIPSGHTQHSTKYPLSLIYDNTSWTDSILLPSTPHFICCLNVDPVSYLYFVITRYKWTPQIRIYNRRIKSSYASPSQPPSHLNSQSVTDGELFRDWVWLLSLSVRLRWFV